MSVSWNLYDPALTETESESERRLYQVDLTLSAKCYSFTCTIHTVVLVLLTYRPLGYEHLVWNGVLLVVPRMN